jgi:hypothetical protein
VFIDIKYSISYTIDLLVLLLSRVVYSLSLFTDLGFLYYYNIRFLVVI